jgi:hypothetical protein
MAVCSEIHTKHINTLCGQNVELLNVKLAVHIVTTKGLNLGYKNQSVNVVHPTYYPVKGTNTETPKDRNMNLSCPLMTPERQALCSNDMHQYGEMSGRHPI